MTSSIVGGGINGAAIARDAAGRGLNVLLVEQGDLAQATSSASTKLIHGGLRYLEYREFGLVRKALAERETMLRAAPEIIRPLRFVIPQGPGARPWLVVRAGLLLYDLLAWGGSLPRSRAMRLAEPALKPDAQARLRLLGRVGRRCPPGRPQRARRRRRGADDPHAHAACRGAARGRALARQDRGRRRAARRPSAPARSSTPPGRGSREVLGQPARGARRAAACGSCAAATSSCRASAPSEDALAAPATRRPRRLRHPL